MRNEGGEDPDILAARHGYGSAEEMLNAMLEAEGKEKLVRRLAQEREDALRQQLERGLADKNSLPADDEYHNDDRLAVLIAEWKALQNAAGKQRGRNVDAAAARAAAREAIAQTKVSALHPHRHSLAERKAMKKAIEAATKGDMETAAMWKQREVLAHALYMESRDAREVVESGVKAMREASRQKSLQEDTRNLLFDMAVAHGVIQYGNQPDPGAGFRQYTSELSRAGKPRPSLDAWLKRVGENGYPVNLGADGDVLALQAQVFYRDMSFTEFAALRDAFAQIRHVDREERTVILDGKRRELEAVRDELLAAAEANGTEVTRARHERDLLWNKTRAKIAGAHATLTKMEEALIKLDGYERGVWWRTFFKPLADSKSNKFLILKEAAKKLHELANTMLPGAVDRWSFFNKRIRIEGIQESLTMAQIVSMALNVGNSVNKERLLTGEGWSQGQLDAVLDQMEQKHWDFVQGIWKYIGTFKDPSFALQRDLTGAEPQAVQPETVHTKFGDYEGGYYPIVYDKDTGFKAWERAMKDMGDAIFGGTSYGTMQTRQGHLKERAKGGTGEPLADYLDVIADHIFNVAHDIAYRRAIINVAKLLRDKAIGDAMEKYLGPELRKEFKPWLQNIARESNEQYIWATGLMRRARNAVVVFYLGWKVSTMLMQLTDMVIALAQKGEGRNTAKGLALMYADPRKMPERIRFIMEKSPFMANRLEEMDREFKFSTGGLRLIEGRLKRFKDTSLKGIGIVQLTVDMPIWMGAYEAELAKSGDDALAVAVADSTVRLTTGSGSDQDLASIQRGAEWKKLITMFYTPFSAHYNLLARRGGQAKKAGWKDVPGLAAYAFILWVVAPALGKLVTGQGPDEDEEWDSWLLNIALREPFSVLPMGRDVASAVGTGFGYEPTPAVAVVKNSLKFGEAVYKGITDDDWEGIGKKSAVFGGMAAGMFGAGGIVTSQAITTIGNVWDYMAEDTPDFELRDLFFKKPKSRR
jgi:hypothetical protein